MTKWTSTTGNTVEVLPWMDKGFKFISLNCKECIGGYIASGRLEMVYMPDPDDDNSKMITDESTVEINLGTTELGTILKIQGIITDREYLRNLFTVEFSCIPDVDFWKRRGTLVSTNIDDAISSLWKGEKDIRTTSDLPDGITFNQASEYDHDYLHILCESYKKDTIFAFGLDGLLIKDLVGIDSSGQKEPYWSLPGNCHAIQDVPGRDRYMLTYDPKLYMKTSDPWEESDVTSKYWSIKTFDKKYRMMSTPNSILRENQLYNNRFYTSQMYNQIVLEHTSFLQVYRLGDVVKYFRVREEGDKMPWETYIISSIEYHYRSEPSPGDESDGLPPFRLRYTLHCIEEKGTIMSDSDPIRESSD